MIQVKHVVKDYKITQQGTGIKGMISSFFHPHIKTVHAIKDVSFDVQAGELIGIIGENGAGKSTLIKMMTGILYPTSGEIIVDGLRPYNNRVENARKIGVVFGQRSRLVWELPMLDTFALYKEIYQINDMEYKQNIDLFVSLLEMQSYINTPIRHLSLGQRMRVEIALSMLHNPKLLFLDEPTIGLDVIGKKVIRDFFKYINKTKGTTIVLTSHDMKDFDAIALRLLLVKKGLIFFDGTLEQLYSKFAFKREIIFTFAEPIYSTPIGEIKQQGYKLVIDNKQQSYSLPELITQVNKMGAITDMQIRTTDIEDVIREIYQK